jgi:cephalosporin-C deacetylase-like acetyl esterase
MVSRGNERVTGYFAAPKEKKEHPMIITLVPLEERSANPLADFTAPFESAEMVIYLKQRGYGDDVVKNLLTDMLLAMDFAFSREEIKKTQVYIQGKGFAAACAMVSSAMDDRIAGAFMESPNVSLLTASYSMESITKHIKAPLLLGTGLQKDTYSLQEIFSLFNSINAPKEYFVIPDSNTIPRDRWKYIRDVFILRTKD